MVISTRIPWPPSLPPEHPLYQKRPEFSADQLLIAAPEIGCPHSRFCPSSGASRQRYRDQVIPVRWQFGFILPMRSSEALESNHILASGCATGAHFSSGGCGVSRRFGALDDVADCVKCAVICATTSEINPWMRHDAWLPSSQRPLVALSCPIFTGRSTGIPYWARKFARIADSATKLHCAKCPLRVQRVPGSLAFSPRCLKEAPLAGGPVNDPSSGKRPRKSAMAFTLCLGSQNNGETTHTRR